MPVERGAHPRGGAGIQASVAKVREFALAGMGREPVIAWAKRSLRDANYPKRRRDQMQALLGDVRRRTHWVADPYDTEAMQTPEKTLCLEGAGICHFAGDCDDLLIAMLAVLLAVGIPCCVVHQSFNPRTLPDGRKLPATDHVIVGAYDGREWARIDPSYFDNVDEIHKPDAETWYDVATGKRMCTGSPTCTPRNPPTVPELIAGGRPTGDFVGFSGALGGGMFGEADVAQQGQLIAQWGQVLEALDADMMAGFARAQKAIAGLNRTRQQLGKPPTDSDWTADVVKAWGTTWIAVSTLHGFAEDAIAHRRNAVWFVQDGGQAEIGLTALPSDRYGVFTSADGQTLVLQGVAELPPPAPNPGGLGQAQLIPVAIAAAAAAVIVTVAGAYLTAQAVCSTIEQMAKVRQTRDLAEETNKLIAQGATPAEAAKLLGAIGDVQAVSNPPPSTLASVAKDLMTGLTVVAGIGLTIWAVDRFVPKRLEGHAA